MNKNMLVETLRAIRFLHGVPREHLEQIAGYAHFRDFDESEVIFREGDVADRVYFIVFGSVSLEMCSPDIGSKHFLTAGPGEAIGLSSMLEQTQLSATARADDTTRLLQVPSSQLLALCERDPQFGYDLMRRAALALAKRLSATRNDLLNLYRHNLPAGVHAMEGM